MLIRSMTVAVLVLSALVVAVGLSPVQTAHAQPEILSSDPRDGATVTELPSKVRFCFNEPVVHATQNDFQINVFTPLDGQLATRITFNGAGDCLELVANWVVPVFGEYQVQWEVVSQADGSRGSGVLTFVLKEVGGTPGSGISDLLRLILIIVGLIAVGVAFLSVRLWWHHRAGVSLEKGQASEANGSDESRRS